MTFDRLLERYVRRLEENVHQNKKWRLDRRLKSLKPKKTQKVFLQYIEDKQWKFLRDSEFILVRRIRFFSGLLNSKFNKHNNFITGLM